MFRGSIPQHIQQMLLESVSTWLCKDVYVGCSGNFTVERVLLPSGKFSLHSNDITIYSSAIGAYFARQEFPLTLKPEYEDRFGWLVPYIQDKADSLATIMLASKLTEGLRRDGTIKENSYYKRMYEATRDQWKAMHTKTADKIRASDIVLSSYFCGDFYDWIDTVPQEAGVISYPPFFAAARDYEHMFEKIDLLFDWQRPTFAPLTDDRINEVIAKMTSKRFWMYGTKNERPDLAEYLRGIAQTTNRGLPLYLYCSHGATRVVAPRQEIMPVLVPRLEVGQEIGSKLTIAPLDHRQFGALRSQYMNIHIRPGQVTQSYGVMVDGKLIGAYAFSTAPNPAAYNRPSSVYLLSDFAVAPTDYPKLSKLVLYAALSKESKMLAERIAHHRIREATTTAFSKRPVSMKYRGLFELIGRKENKVKEDSTDHTNQPFQLQYAAPMGEWSLDEGMKAWAAKHNERVSHANQSNQD